MYIHTLYIIIVYTADMYVRMYVYKNVYVRHKIYPKWGPRLFARSSSDLASSASTAVAAAALHSARSGFYHEGREQNPINAEGTPRDSIANVRSF